MGEKPTHHDSLPSPEKSNSPFAFFGIYRPEYFLTNKDIEKKGLKTASGHDFTADKAREITGGVEKRYVAGPTETPLSMGFAATEQALLKTEGRIDALIVSTSFPTGEDLSLEIRKKLAEKYPDKFNDNVFLLNVHAACSGIGMSLAYIKDHETEFEGKNVMLIATEKYSDHLQKLENDPGLARILFSDGAVAMSTKIGKGFFEITNVIKHEFPKNTDPNIIRMPIDPALLRGNYLYEPMPVPRSAVYDRDGNLVFPGFFEQDGHIVFRLMRNEVPSLLKKAISDIKSALIDIHQANGKMIGNMVKNQLSGLNIKKSSKEGNWSSGSILKVIMKAFEKGEIKQGDTFMMLPFGAGPLAYLIEVKFGQKNNRQAEELQERVFT